MVFAAEAEVLLGVGRIGSVAFEFFDGGLFAILARFGQHKVVLRVDHGGPARHLAGTNVGGEEIGAHLHHVGSDDRAPGVAEDDYFLFAQLVAEIFGELDTVLGDAVKRDVGRVCAIAAKGVAGTALVPLHNGEGFFPWLIHFGLRPLRFAWASVDNEQPRVRAVVAPNADPLLQSAEGNECGFNDCGGGLRACRDGNSGKQNCCD
jgi:hypothetical protein